MSGGSPKGPIRPEPDQILAVTQEQQWESNMATRAYWSGHLRVSLVSFAVKLYPASSPARQIAFHQIDRRSGKRVRQQLVVPGAGPIDRADIVKGYEYQKDHYIEIDPDELKSLRLPSRDTIDIVQFVGVDEIDPIYYENAYYLVPDDKLALPGFATVREAMRATRTAGLGEVVFGGREHLAAIRPCGQGLVLDTLRYADEVRRAAPYFDEIGKIDIDADQLDLARKLIAQKTRPLDMAKFSDSYESAVKELVDAKLHERPLPAEAEDAPRGNVVNLMDALKKSLGAEGAAGGETGAKAAKTRPPKSGKAAPKRAKR
jgi:DNA end-binding protein Ku